VRGDAPEIDLKQLERELRGFLQDLIHGDFMKQHIPPEVQRINDIALSGNGEPTSSKQFPQVINIISAVLKDFQLLNKIKLVLITNGSFIYKDYIQQGLKHMAELNGEVWFKVDSATPDGIAVINQVKRSMDQVKKNLGMAALLCPTWVQTCVFTLDGKHLSDSERKSYLAFLEELKKNHVPIKGVLLYGLARPSHQPEASRLAKVPESWIKNLAADIQKIGLPTKLAA
jgi:wyosine [tRNA(Phe)-imidazoG37] synthetase (radical SAM superfamily)